MCVCVLIFSSPVYWRPHVAVHKPGHSDLYRVFRDPQGAGRALLQNPVPHFRPPQHFRTSGTKCTDSHMEIFSSNFLILILTLCNWSTFMVRFYCLIFVLACVSYHSWLSVLATQGSMTSWRRAFPRILSNHCHRATCEWDLKTICRIVCNNHR